MKFLVFKIANVAYITSMDKETVFEQFEYTKRKLNNAMKRLSGYYLNGAEFEIDFEL